MLQGVSVSCGCCICCSGYIRVLQVYYFKYFSCFRRMLHLFYLGVAYVSHIYCNYFIQMLHMFHTYVPSVIWMLHMFCNGYTRIFWCFRRMLQVFQLFSDVCCKCLSRCCKSRSGVAHIAVGPTTTAGPACMCMGVEGRERQAWETE